MNKKLLVLMTVAAFAGVTNGALQVNWSGTEGFVRNDGVTPIADGIAVHGTPLYLAQLLWTPDAVISLAGPGGAVTGNEVLLQSVVVTYFGDEYGFLPPQNYVGAYPGAGNVYARVFDIGSDNPANIVPGSWYYAGPLLAGNDEADPSVYQPYVIHDGTGPFEPSFATNELNLQVIPEPSVFAMLGLGGLFLMIRRRFVKA